MVCKKCGKEIEDNSTFCKYCGEKLTLDKKGDFIGNIVDKASDKISLGGESQSLRLKDLFSDVFKKHSKLESEEIFKAGFTGNEIEEKDMQNSWPKPWLFSRIFALLLICTVMLTVMLSFFENANAYAGLIFIGSCCVPFSILFFIFEANVPRNITIIQVIKMFFIGGIASLLITLFLSSIVGGVKNGYLSAVIVGIVEELAKAIVTFALLKIIKKTKYVLNGLLIGACVGCGFAIFESAGYAFRFLLMGGDGTMYSVLFTRNLLSFGGHIPWAAMAGGAMVLANGEGPFTIKGIMKKEFWIFFGGSIILHMLWDMPFPLGKVGSYALLIVFCIIAILGVFIVINLGLKQISSITLRENEEEMNDDIKEEQKDPEVE